MKSLYTFLFALLIVGVSMAQSELTITEISYNPPESNTDSLEYIEILNTSGGVLDVTGWTFTKGVEYTFDQVLAADEYVVVAVNANAMQSVLGVTAQQFMGALTNGGEEIEIADASGNVMDYVDYSDSGAWPSSANGTDGAGASIELCDINSDNSDGSNWRAATNDTGAIADGTPYLGTPGTANTVVCMDVTFMDVTIEEAVANDANGEPVMDGASVRLSGIVHGVNLNPDGLQFTIINSDNEGIGLFSGSETFGYTVMEGDNVTVEGSIGQFNGLTQISPVSLVANGADTPVSPREVTMLDESTESSLVVFEEMIPVDIAQWTPGAGSGFNVDFADDAGNMITVRIDNDTDLFTAENVLEQNGNYSITGIGGQFDNEGPEYFDGYQLLPRYALDISQLIVDNTNDIQQSLNSDLKVFPNPVDATLSWELESTDQVTAVSVMNQMAQQVRVVDGNVTSIDVADLMSGYYTVRVQTAHQSYFQTFVKK